MDVKLIERIEGALQFCAQFMDAVAPDAKNEGWWTKHDQHVRDEVSWCLSVLQQQMAASAPVEAAGMRPAVIALIDKFSDEAFKRGGASSWHYGELADAILALLPTDAAVKALVEAKELEGFINGLMVAGNMKSRFHVSDDTGRVINDLRRQIDEKIEATRATLAQHGAK